MENQIKFESSHGSLFVDRQGNIDLVNSNLSDWLLNIAKVDIEELENYFSFNKCVLFDDTITDYDILDFCFWDKAGNYYKADMNWRIEDFHNQEFTKEEVIDAVNKSIEWINQNRANYTIINR